MPKGCIKMATTPCCENKKDERVQHMSPTHTAHAAYGMGMLTTFLALELMQNAQPALLYLVPFTIIPTVTTAWSKGHLFAIWNGVKLRENGGKEGDGSGTKTALLPIASGHVATGGSSAPDFALDDAEGADSGTKERHRSRPKSKNQEGQGGEPGSSKDHNMPIAEGGSVDGGDGHGTANDDELAASPFGAASPGFAECVGEAEGAQTRAGASVPSSTVLACDECPATDVVQVSHKRLPLHVSYNTWEDRFSRFMFSHNRKKCVAPKHLGRAHHKPVDCLSTSAKLFGRAV
ncbi:hypothetical protein HPB50_021508 [Hyalomma asiaticum]|uniref:Uncharacterized protein n=1 Tax=Hyalomma asiaticum TaxID=266040 RepID=A0ACB7SJS0_HYAAI|nr:hypothetical protein HPB50_021508 [Hyalomma asiaticum]